jgi:hypothetical protein
MSTQDPEGGLGRLDDDAEEREASDTTEGAAARGEYDPGQGSPDEGEHPTGADYPDEATRYDEPERKRPVDPER